MPATFVWFVGLVTVLGAVEAGRRVARLVRRRRARVPPALPAARIAGTE